MGLDDYYIDRDKIAPGPDGKLDLEHINTIDCALFREDMARLFRGRRYSCPALISSPENGNGRDIACGSMMIR